jgi:hypothetical protein
MALIQMESPEESVMALIVSIVTMTIADMLLFGHFKFIFTLYPANV